MGNVLSYVQIQWNHVNVCKWTLNGLWVRVIGKTFRVEALIIRCALFISPWSNQCVAQIQQTSQKACMLGVWINELLVLSHNTWHFQRHQAALSMINNQHVPNLWFRLSYDQWYRYGPAGLPSATGVFANIASTILRCLIITGITYWSGDSCRGLQGFNYTWDDWSPWSIDHRMISES